MMILSRATDIETLKGIIALQAANLEKALTPEALRKEGFVTVVHDLASLSAICGDFHHIVAKDPSGQVQGYVLVMLQAYRNSIPILQPMFRKIDTLVFDGKALAGSRYMVMGQVCIAKNYRGQGWFKALYDRLFDELRGHFDYIITEVSDRNPRSLSAHHKIGFQTICQDTAGGETWHLLLHKMY